MGYLAKRICAFFLVCSLMIFSQDPCNMVQAKSCEVVKTVEVAQNTPILSVRPPRTVSVKKFEPSTDISEEEIELLALITMAEAEGECEEGQRLVIDTVLNRVDSPYFPNTITEVINQPGQFSPMSNGRIERCYVRDDIYQLVLEELSSRTNTEVVFFRSGHFSEYGVPMFQLGGHYFSSYA